MKRRAFCAAALGLVMMGPALAQGQGGPGGGRPGFGGPGGFRGGMGFGLSGLLRMQEVQKELKLDQAQIALLDGIRPAGPGGPGGPRPGGPGGPGGNFNPEEFRKRMEQQRAEEEKKIGEILDAKQMARLKQLDIQRQGIRAIGRPDVAAALKLTPDQKQKFEAAQQGERDAMRAAFEAARSQGGQPDFQAMRTKMQEMRTSTDGKINAILTPQQKTQFQSMQGAPFKFPELRFGPGGPGGPGGRRPQ